MKIETCTFIRDLILEKFTITQIEWLTDQLIHHIRMSEDPTYREAIQQNKINNEKKLKK